MRKSYMTEIEKMDGFKFALTLFATFGTIIYTVYNYFQKYSVDVFSYSFASAVIAVMIILFFLLIFYVLIKGISMEVQNSNLKNSLEKIASQIYQISFFVSILIFIVVFSVHFFINNENWPVISGIIIFVSMIVIGLLLSKSYKIKSLQNIFLQRFLVRSMVALVVGAILWVIIYTAISASPLQGQVTIDMDSIYYKNVTQIPAFIQVTGPNTGLTITLSKENPERKMTKIDSISYLEPNHNPGDNVSDEHSNLTANSLANGKYNVFINATNLSRGYYELRVVRYKYNKTDVKGFYLLNANEKS